MNINYHLEGKVALVTGGSRGLGYTICQSLLESGANVVFIASSAEVGKKAEEELSKLGSAEFVRCNVCNEDDVNSVVSGIVKKYGKLDCLVLNAGATTSAPQRLAEYTYDEMRRLFQVNVDGNFICMKAAINAMLQNEDGGSIVAVSSALTEYVRNGFGPYSGAKGALNNIIKSAASEYAPDGIRVNEVLPGSMNTPTMEAFKRDDPEGYKAAMDDTPLRRVAEPIEIARAVTWLCSDDAAYITGAKLVIDGGVSL